MDEAFGCTIAAAVLSTVCLFSPLIANGRFSWFAALLTSLLPATLALWLQLSPAAPPLNTVITPRGPSPAGQWTAADDNGTAVYGEQANHDFCEANYVARKTRNRARPCERRSGD